MSSGVFVIREDGSLIPMQQSGFESEDLLQDLIAKHPDLLAGNLINVKNPRKWLLIDREYGIPDKADSNNRWSIDHLFLDQDGIPTLVEVKRSSDTRIRREVVGQMLDYAANAVQHWNMERIIACYENKCFESELDPQEIWEQTFNVVTGYQEYWDNVKSNLEVGKIRLLFVADVIPFELRQIVEFLNSHFDTIEVLAVELQQYTGDVMKTLIPRVYGQTTTTEAKKYTYTKREAMTREDLFSNLDSNGLYFFDMLLSAAEKHGHDIHPVSKGFHLRVHVEGKPVAYCSVHPTIDKSPQYVKTTYNNIFYDLEETEELLSYRKKFLDTGLYEPSGSKREVKWVVGSEGRDKVPFIVDLYMKLADEMKKSKMKQ